MEEKIVLDKHSFKALAADTRVRILKILAKRRHTQSELAADLNLSIPTVKEHLKAMEKAELVKMKDEGRKWKYYELTRKSRGILDPEMKKIWILLSVIGLMVFAGLSGIMKEVFNPMLASQFGAMETESFNALAKTGKGMPDVGERDAQIMKAVAPATDSVVDDTSEAIKLGDEGTRSFATEETAPETLEALADMDESELVEAEETTGAKIVEEIPPQLPRPAWNKIQWNLGMQLYIGILAVLLVAVGYLFIVRHYRMKDL